MNPLVSVVCLCYNHERFVEEAVLSVINQTYSPIEIVIVDDASTDGSRSKIAALVSENPSLKYIQLERNIGNCRAFNEGLKHCAGEFIVDFATDDVFVPDRIAKQVQFFHSLPGNYGVVFTDAIYIDERGTPSRKHVEYLLSNKLLRSVPSGDVYKDVLDTYFIPAPTMLVKREVFTELEGYDGDLAYEDFDFWIRSARHFKYGYLDEPLTFIRKVAGSLSRRSYRRGDRQLHSTFLVCQKALRLNRTPEEHSALLRRVRYEIRQCVLTGNRNEAKLFYQLLLKMDRAAWRDRIWYLLSKLNLPLYSLREWYYRIRYR